MRTSAAPRCSPPAARPALARANHVEHAGRQGDAAAVALLREAGQEVVQRTPAGAVRWFTAALRLLPSDAPAEERIGLLMSAAAAMAAAGQFEDARATLMETERLVPADAVAVRANLAVASALVEGLMSLHEDARARLDRALHDAATTLPPAQARELLHHLMVNAVYRQDYVAARAWALRAYEVSEPLGENRCWHASSAAALALAEALGGRAAEAEAHLAEAVAVVDAMSDAELAAAHRNAEARSRPRSCTWTGSAPGTANAERALTIARATGQVQLFPMFAPVIGWLLGVQGAAGRLGRAARGRGRGRAPDRQRPRARLGAVHGALTEIQRGNLDAALAAGEESLALTAGLDVDSVVACYSGLNVRPRARGERRARPRAGRRGRARRAAAGARFARLLPRAVHAAEQARHRGRGDADRRRPACTSRPRRRSAPAPGCSSTAATRPRQPRSRSPRSGTSRRSAHRWRSLWRASSPAARWRRPATPTGPPRSSSAPPRSSTRAARCATATRPSASWASSGAVATAARARATLAR